jgi:hypothetical protein
MISDITRNDSARLVSPIESHPAAQAARWSIEVCNICRSTLLLAYMDHRSGAVI